MSKKTGVNHGGRRPGAGRPSWRDLSTFYAEPAKLSPEVPSDPSDIVIAQSSDEKYGVYIGGDWYGAGQALVILAYLQEYKTWLEERARENIR